MATMTLSAKPIADRDLTRADYEETPDDGLRYELIEGELVVAPSPSRLHQVISMELSVLLHQASPEHLRVLAAPMDVELDPVTIVEPDVLVVEATAAGDKTILGPPLLVVEILSPATRRRDLTRKKDLYERSGVRSFWVIDPDGDVTLNAWELRGARYELVASVAGEQEWRATAPYEVVIVPGRLRR